MDLNFDYRLVQSQKLLLTPRIRQAFEILKMNSQDLGKYIAEQVEANPLLDLVEPEDELYMEDGADDLKETEDEQEDFDNRFFKCVKNGSDIPDDSILDFFSNRISLKDYLTLQLHLLCLDKRSRAIGEYIIGNLNEDGYLTVRVSDISAFFHVPAKKVVEVVQKIQSFDPPGVCARNLKECLLLQLKHMGCDDPDVYNIVCRYLKDLAKEDALKVAERSGLPYGRVVEIINFIKSLEPRPGRQFGGNGSFRHPVPDVYVKKICNQYEVIINEDALPEIRINRHYSNLEEKNIGKEARAFIQSCINNGMWLIKCVEQRKLILRKITECLMAMQREFLDKGRKHIHPSTVAEIGNQLKMHETIVKNAVKGKYLHCRWGVFEMDCFLKDA